MIERISSRVRRVALAFGTFGLLATGAIGLLHTPAGRPYLRFIPGMGVCPLGIRSDLTASDREEARNHALPRGERAATARPALGFVLDKTTKGDVGLWQLKTGVTCHDGSSGVSATCDDVPSELLDGGRSLAVGAARTSSVTFRFDQHERLVAIVRTSESTEAPNAISAHKDALLDVTEHAGPATWQTGEANVAYLEGGALHQARTEFHFTNYYASMSATNMGGRFVVTEEYQAIHGES